MNCALAAITPEQRETLDLSSWDVAYNGAEPIRADTMERFAATFADCGFRPGAFHPCYGLAEATLLVSGGSLSDEHVPSRSRWRHSNRTASWRPRPGSQMCGRLSAAAALCPTQRLSSLIRNR